MPECIAALLGIFSMRWLQSKDLFGTLSISHVFIIFLSHNPFPLMLIFDYCLSHTIFF